MAYKEENTLHPGDGVSAARLFPALAGIVNGERNFLTSKPNKRIPTNNKKKFGRTKTGKNKKSPVAQVNTTNASNATPLIPQRKTSDKDDPDDGVTIQEITSTQLLMKARDLLQTKENCTKKITELQSKIGQIHRDAYDKDQVIDYMTKENFQKLEVKDDHKKQVISSLIKELFKELEGKYDHIKVMHQIHATKLYSKDKDLRDMANKMIYDRKKLIL